MASPLQSKPRPNKLRILTLLALGPLALSLSQCGAKPPVVVHAVPPIACTSTPTCQTVANLPFCADSYTSFCSPTFNECMYRIKKDPACPCIERDVRACTLAGGGQGIQECVVDNPKTHTWWNTCHAC